MDKVLIAFDTDHIHGYVFGTDTLKEIRGGSSRLDRLNRHVMQDVANRPEVQATLIYTAGGAGLFVIDSKEQAEKFGRAVQKEYREVTGGGSSITYAIQPLPKDAPDDKDALMNYPIQDTLTMMRYRLNEKKDTPPAFITHPSHPFMFLCQSCGIEYADQVKYADQVELAEDKRLCESCSRKRDEDWDVKKSIDSYLSRSPEIVDAQARRSFQARSPLWADVIENLQSLDYKLPKGVDRPQDFDMFSTFAGAKGAIALIYADGNNMGKRIEELDTLGALQTFAIEVDTAVKKAVSAAIKQHLPVVTVSLKGQETPLFPFDILLLGGDDVVMVTSASVAMDVALTIAEKFHIETNHKYTLSVGVVLIPIKYPFGMSLGLAESALQFAKTEAAKRKRMAKDGEKAETGMINFMTVLGSAGRDFTDIYRLLKQTDDKHNHTRPNFYATLRPYDTKQLETLLKEIRRGHLAKLGRTKLYQLREAILEMNLTTSRSNARALWRNWKPQQRELVIDCLNTFANQYEGRNFQADDPTSFAYERPFPWFADSEDEHGRKVYRTSLLDFVELYDFVTGEEADGGDEN